MPLVLANNAVSRLAATLASGGTSLTVTTGDGAKFPSPGTNEWFPVTLVKDTGALEIVRCTARASDVLTIVRAQEGTSALGFAVGDRVEVRLTEAAFFAGGKMRGAINAADTVVIASSATTDIGAAASNSVDISGTTTITGLGTISSGVMRVVRFTGALTLTHNATSLILPAGANISVAAGDCAVFRSLGSGNWVCALYMPATGKPVAFAFDRGNVVGTVSQASGIPTGAIIEQGSNVNGRFVKYADGTMICWYYGTTSYAINSASGTGVFNSTLVSLTFPVAFSANSAVPVVTPAAISPTGYYSWAATEPGAANVTTCALRLVSPSGSATAYFSYIAIGRWF